MTTTGPWRRAAAGAGLLGPDGTPGTTIFAEMSALAMQTGAVNLGQGFPDEDGPEAVLAEAVAACGRGEPVDLEAELAAAQASAHASGATAAATAALAGIAS